MSGLASLGRGKMTIQEETNRLSILGKRDKKLVEFTTLFTKPQIGVCIELNRKISPEYIS